MDDLLAVGLAPVGSTILLGPDVLENWADLTPPDRQARIASWN
jgi:hypothetical protein